MDYKEIINKEEDSATIAGEPVMAAAVADAPKMMTTKELKDFCQKHLDSATLTHFEENNYFADKQIPFDTIPQNEEEWMQMASDAESSGWVSEEDFLNHISQWNHAR